MSENFFASHQAVEKIGPSMYTAEGIHGLRDVGRTPERIEYQEAHARLVFGPIIWIGKPAPAMC